MNFNFKKTFILALVASTVLLLPHKTKAQSDAAIVGAAAGAAAITFLAADAAVKETAKEVSQFRSKEFIMEYIIGPVGDKEVKFETETTGSPETILTTEANTNPATPPINKEGAK